MLRLIIPFAILIACGTGCGHSGLESINPLLGDISFESKFGRQPFDDENEDLRIKTHLEYVESLLRNKDVSKLTPDLQEKREMILGFLHDYWVAGIFPRNRAVSWKRAPCFIDDDGTICAVGYLVQQTAGRKIAEMINSKYQYDELLAMNDEAVDSWIASSGLTKEECAMIQPRYNYEYKGKINDISSYFGRSFRINDGSYHTAEVTFGKIVTGRRHRSILTGIGLRADYFENDNFSLALRYFKLVSKRARLIYPYCGISPVLFSFGHETGFNLKPEFGVLLHTGSASMFAFCLNLAYGYDIPVYNEKSFLAGRHDLSAKVGVSARLEKIAKALQKKAQEPEKKPDPPRESPKE